MIGLTNPWVILGAVGVVTLSLGSGYVKGRWDGADRCEERIQEMVDASQAAKDAEAAKAAEASTELETEDAEAEIIYRTITRDVEKIVDRPIYVNRCLDDDGLSIARAALAGPAAFAGQPRPIVPEPGP